MDASVEPTVPRWWTPAEITLLEPDSLAFLEVEDTTDDVIKGKIRRWPTIASDGAVSVDGDRPFRLQSLDRQQGSLAGIRKLRIVRRVSGSKVDWLGKSPSSLTPDVKLPALQAGDIAAVSVSKPDVFWEQTDPVESWQPMCKPVLRFLDKTALEHHFTPYAWSMWRDWLGSSDLVSRLVRRAVELVAAHGGNGSLRIEAAVGEDVETFSSIDLYLAGATTVARNAPDSLFVAVGGLELGLNLTIARKSDRRKSWLKNGVLLEVASADAANFESVAVVHRDMEIAVNRGTSGLALARKTSIARRVRFRPAPAQAEEGPAPKERTIAKRRAVTMVIFVVGTVGSLLGVALSYGWGGVAIMGGFIGLVLGGILTFCPGVEFGERRSTRWLRLAGKLLVVPALGAAIGGLVKLILDGRLLG